MAKSLVLTWKQWWNQEHVFVNFISVDGNVSGPRKCYPKLDPTGKVRTITNGNAAHIISKSAVIGYHRGKPYYEIHESYIQAVRWQLPEIGSAQTNSDPDATHVPFARVELTSPETLYKIFDTRALQDLMVAQLLEEKFKMFTALLWVTAIASMAAAVFGVAGLI